jgi:hypothetical protein
MNVNGEYNHQLQAKIAKTFRFPDKSEETSSLSFEQFLNTSEKAIKSIDVLIEE